MEEKALLVVRDVGKGVLRLKLVHVFVLKDAV